MAHHWQKYFKILSQRLYRPLRPLVGPLLKRIKLTYLLVGMLTILIGSGFLPVNERYRAQIIAGNWPYLSSSHALMSLAWFDAGNEEMARKELKLTSGQDLIRTEQVIELPEKVRNQIASWEKKLLLMPYHQEILMRLAVANARIYENEKANQYLQKAQYLNPLISPLPFSLP